MKINYEIPNIPESEQTPIIKSLLNIIQQFNQTILRQNDEIQTLKDEINRLKGHKGKPNIKPSQMTNDPKPKPEKRPGSEKRQKTKNLKIHESIKIKIENVPEGAVFKGYKEHVVQELKVEVKNTKYLLARWLLDDGKYLTAALPNSLKNQHFGPTLKAFVIQQHHGNIVTQPLLLRQLKSFGVDISAGQLNNILTEHNEIFTLEKEDVLIEGLKRSSYINVDDTGARHKGQNGYCTHIGNELFTYFKSTKSKSRINFLEILLANNISYTLNLDSFDYMNDQKLNKDVRQKLKDSIGDSFVFESKESFESHLTSLSISKKNHLKTITEAALLGSLMSDDLYKDLKVVSDDAGQFDILKHALCWVHAERHIHKLIPLDEAHAKDKERVQSQIWDIYADLKSYKLNPNDELKTEIERKFDVVCKTKTNFMMLNDALNRLYKNKDELLLVLKYPELPLHNNMSESDIREYVTKRKRSGGTRSDNGKESRDTFASLKKTCMKLGVNFWDYLVDRFNQLNEIPRLSQLIHKATS